MPIEYLQIVTLFVADQDRAKQFYVGVLGWNLLSDATYVGVHGEQLRWLEVRPPDGQTAISLAATGGQSMTTESNGLTLRASDLESTVAALQQRGVEFTAGITESPHAKYTKFNDPDNNVWMVQEMRPGRK